MSSPDWGTEREVRGRHERGSDTSRRSPLAWADYGTHLCGLKQRRAPNWAIAYIIDAIVLFVINLVVAAIRGAIGLVPATINADLTISVNYVALLDLRSRQPGHQRGLLQSTSG